MDRLVQSRCACTTGECLRHFKTKVRPQGSHYAGIVDLLPSLTKVRLQGSYCAGIVDLLPSLTWVRPYYAGIVDLLPSLTIVGSQGSYYAGIVDFLTIDVVIDEKRQFSLDYILDSHM